MHCRATVITLSLFALVAAASARAADKPTILRTPDRGIQPQAVADAKGVIHLLYFKGQDSAGDLFYVRKEPGQERFSAPIRVNSQPGSAIAVGTIRGGQIALGKNGRVHVAWNGSGAAMPRSAGKSSPMLYARLDDDSKAFEPQRNLITQTYQLDGGGTVAADDKGNVYVAWHGPRFNPNASAPPGEANRQVWLAHSTDDGKTFARETAVNRATGACGCCGMKAFADSKGVLYMLYRSATAGVNRDMYLLTSKDKGKTFQSVLVQRWNVNGCPMSSEAFAEGPKGTLAAWETQGLIYFSPVTRIAKPQAVPGTRGKCKHPAIAQNAKGETLLVWTEDTGWNKGGSLVWQVFGTNGRPTGERGRVDGGAPVWGLPTAVATPDGFVLIH